MNFHSSQYAPYSYLYPDLGLIIEHESSLTPTPQHNNGFNWVCALATLGLVSFGLWANQSNLEQASQQIQKDIYTDYVSLTQDIL